MKVVYLYLMVVVFFNACSHRNKHKQQNVGKVVISKKTEDTIKPQKQVLLTIDSSYKATDSRLDIYITYGFKEKQHFLIFLNNNLIKDCYWKTVSVR